MLKLENNSSSHTCFNWSFSVYPPVTHLVPSISPEHRYIYTHRHICVHTHTHTTSRPCHGSLSPRPSHIHSVFSIFQQSDADNPGKVLKSCSITEIPPGSCSMTKILRGGHLDPEMTLWHRISYPILRHWVKKPTFSWNHYYLPNTKCLCILKSNR